MGGGRYKERVTRKTRDGERLEREGGGGRIWEGARYRERVARERMRWRERERMRDGEKWREREREGGLALVNLSVSASLTVGTGQSSGLLLQLPLNPLMAADTLKSASHLELSASRRAAGTESFQLTSSLLACLGWFSLWFQDPTLCKNTVLFSFR